MNKFIGTPAAILCFLTSIFTHTFCRQPIPEINTLTFKDYRLIQFISSSGSTPQNIINLDNNGEIILACVNGKTREQLQTMGIQFVESQIKLLKTWRVLREENDVLKTSFPILDADAASRLRNYSASAVPSIDQKLRSGIMRFVAILDSIGRSENSYSILFSYILDDLVWNRFQEKGFLNDREITAEMPFWAGEIWAIYPPRDFSMGTNTVSDKGIELKVNWTEKAIPKMTPFVADWKNFARLFDDYVEKGRVENEEAKAVFSPFDLFDASGYFTVPIIVESKDNSLYSASIRIAEQVANEVPSLFDFSALTKSFNFRDNQQTLVIIYHELMWDLMDHWGNEGLISKPIAFLNPEKANPSDIGALVFIVRNSN